MALGIICVTLWTVLPGVTTPSTNAQGTMYDPESGAKPSFLTDPVRYLEYLGADRPALLAFLVFLGTAAIVIPLSLPYWTGTPESFFRDVMVEAQGTLLDALVLVFFIRWLDTLGERRRQIRRYQEEIGDLLGLESEQAKHRIIGNIKRLNREDAVAKNLERAHLKEANLAGASLRGARLTQADLSGATLSNTDLSDTVLVAADLSESYLFRADLSGADLFNANLSGADLQETTFQGTNLMLTDLRGVKNASAEDFYPAATLHRAKLDPEMEKRIRQERPDLLEEPE